MSTISGMAAAIANVNAVNVKRADASGNRFDPMCEACQ